MLRGVELLLAVDIGGTELAVGIVDGDGRLLARRRAPTPAADRDGMRDVLFGLIDGIRDEVDGALVACGIGCGGPMSRGGITVSPLNIPAWVEHPLLAEIAGHTGLPTWLDNDAKALALGEAWAGAARDETDFLAMVVSTGVGGGIVLDGRLLDGASGNAGHIGHVNVVPDGRRCACGARGCLEAEASGTAIAAITGRPAVEADLATRRRTGSLVGRAVGSVASLLDLRLAVVAGSVALGFGEPFFDAAREALEAHSRIGFARGAEIRPAELGDSGPLVGAAAVARRGLGAGRFAP